MGNARNDYSHGNFVKSFHNLLYYNKSRFMIIYRFVKTFHNNISKKNIYHFFNRYQLYRLYHFWWIW